MTNEETLLNQLTRLGCKVIKNDDFVLVMHKRDNKEGTTMVIELYKKDKKLCVASTQSYFSFIDFETLDLLHELKECYV